MVPTRTDDRVFSNILGLTILKGADLMLPLILLPYLVKSIGLEGYGVFSLALAYSLYVGALVQYGFNITAARDLARAIDDGREAAEIVTSILAAQACLAIAGMGLTGLVIALVPSFADQWQTYTAAIIYTVLRMLFPGWLFQATGDMRVVAVAGLAVRAVLVVSILLLVKDADDTSLLLVLYAASSGLLLVFGLLRAKRLLGVLLVAIEPRQVLRTIKVGRYAFQAQLAPTLYNSTTTLILGAVAGEAVVGIMASAQKIIDVLGSGATIMATALLPTISTNIRVHSKFGPAMVLLGGLLAAACAVCADPLTGLIFGASAEQISPVVQWLSISLVGMFAFTAYNQNYLMVIGEDRLATRIVTFVSLAFLVIGVVLIPRFGLVGAVIVLVAGRVSLGLVSCLASRSIATARFRASSIREGDSSNAHD